MAASTLAILAGSGTPMLKQFMLGGWRHVHRPTPQEDAGAGCDTVGSAGQAGQAVGRTDRAGSRVEVGRTPRRSRRQGVGLFSKPATQDDVLQLIDAIRRDTLKEPDASEAVDRGLRRIGNDKNLQTVISSLIVLGQILQRQVPRERLEPVVMSEISRSPHEKSRAASAAVSDLGRALFLNGTSDDVAAIVAAQGRDPHLSTDERSDNLLNLVFAAGWIAAELDLTFEG